MPHLLKSQGNAAFYMVPLARLEHAARGLGNLFGWFSQVFKNQLRSAWLPQLHYNYPTAKSAINAMISHQNWQELARCQTPALLKTLNPQKSLDHFFL